MTTSAELRKIAKQVGFEEKMLSLGFKLGPNRLWFYRERGEYIDYIDFWISSSRKWATVPIMCLRKDLVTHCDISKFPKGFDRNIPFYTSTFINEEYGVEIGGDPWKIDQPETIELSLNEIFSLITSNANGWLNSINSNEALWEKYTINFKERPASLEVKEALLGKGNG